MAKLFVIATPIGNRDDITIRALKTLFEVDVLFCEDTRKTKQLLDYYLALFPEIVKKDRIPVLVSNFEQNEDQRIFEGLNYLRENYNVGLVTNAGTPTISDPGFKLVKACLENGFEVIGIPGPSAIIDALSISGLSSDKFLFVGFLPRKNGKQTKIWEDIRKSEFSKTIVFYESCYRIKKTLENLKSTFGNIEVVIARELTKKFEEVKKMKIDEWIVDLNKPLKGEIVVLFRFNQYFSKSMNEE